MKKALIVIGNVASGKTTFAKKFVKENPEYKLFSLDIYRNKVAAKTDRVSIIGNKQAEKLCLQEMLNHKNVVFETTASNKFYTLATEELKKYNYEITNHIIKCPVNTCIMRYYTRNRSGHFQAFAFREYKIEDTIKYIDKVINNLF